PARHEARVPQILAGERPVSHGKIGADALARAAEPLPDRDAIEQAERLSMLRLVRRLDRAEREPLLVQERALDGVAEGHEIERAVGHAVDDDAVVRVRATDASGVAHRAVEADEVDGRRRTRLRTIPADVDPDGQAVVLVAFGPHEAELRDPVARLRSGGLEVV